MQFNKNVSLQEQIKCAKQIQQTKNCFDIFCGKCPLLHEECDTVTVALDIISWLKKYDISIENMLKKLKI